MFPLINKKETGINLRRIMDQRGITVNDVKEYLGLASVQSIYHWLNGISMPTVDNLYALSALFELPIDEIVRGNRTNINRKAESRTKDARYVRLYSYYEKLNKNRAA